MKLPPAHSYHVLQNLSNLFPAARIIPRGEPEGELYKIDELATNLPTQLSSGFIMPEKYPVLTAVHFAKAGSMFVKMLEQQGAGIVAIVADVNLSGAEGLYLVTIPMDNELTEWPARMTRPQFIVGTSKETTLLAAPIKAFV